MTERWLERTRDLTDRIRDAARETLIDAVRRQRFDEIARPVAEGAGDVTYGLDVPTEDVCSRWLEEVALTAGLERINLETRLDNLGGREFYKACGYRVVGRIPGYYFGRESAVRMTHDIRIA